MNVLVKLDIKTDEFIEILVEEDDFSLINLCSDYFEFRLRTAILNICLRKLYVGDDLYFTIEHIQNCIHNQCELPKELEKNIDLGLEWNNHWQNLMLAEKVGKPLVSWDWFGDNLIFLGTNRDRFNSTRTFLYNDEQGNIILEVSLVYPWFFGEDPPADKYVSYDEWLPEYKVLYKTTISKETAQGWIEQLNDLYKKLEANT